MLSSLRVLTRSTVSVLLCLLGSTAAHAAGGSNPIGWVARLFNTKLVQIEDRMVWLDTRLSTLAPQKEHSMKTGLGLRGGRLNRDDPPPTVTVDFGRVIPLDLLYLVPIQRDSGQNHGIFPRRFILEVSRDPDFQSATSIYNSGTGTFPIPKSTPARFHLNGIEARYLRLTVVEGHQRGAADIFALAEMIVLSGDEPVSFGAEVSVEGAMDVPDTWGPEYLVDGRMPLGIWQSGEWTAQRGDLVIAESPDDSISWTLSLPDRAAMDRLTLFPYQLIELADTGLFPDSLAIHVLLEDGSEELAHEWSNPLPGTSNLTPLTIQLGGREAVGVRVSGLRPWQIGSRHLHALSEIELWSGGKNLARDHSITRSFGGISTQTDVLSDGFASDRQIMPVAIWLSQLQERGSWERELAALQPIRQQMASESELNATWGSAVMLGLTFLIPVVIVERRRLISKNQLDQLRKRIASDLHDDIGSNLGSISLIARTARKDLVRMQGPPEVAEDLGEVESIARESSLAMRDIVWLLERRQDSIGDLVHRMRETAGRMLRGLEFSIECESSKTAAKLALDAKRHLFLFYKEAIHNIMKHSKATRVVVRVRDDGDSLVLEVSDDGIGLPDNPLQRPAAVHKLQERARVLEGLLRIVSNPGQGTSLMLTVKRSNLVALPLS